LDTSSRELTQISHSHGSGHNLTSLGAARYFGYESAVALRNLVAATCHATCWPRKWLSCSLGCPISVSVCSSMRCEIPAGDLTRSCCSRKKTSCWTNRSPARRSPHRSWSFAPSSNGSSKRPCAAAAAGARRRKSSWPSGKQRRKFGTTRRGRCL